MVVINQLRSTKPATRATHGTHTDTGHRQRRQNLPDRDMARTHQDLENPGDVYPIFHFDSTNFSGNLLMDAS
jgi:hypothetical protein